MLVSWLLTNILCNAASSDTSTNNEIQSSVTYQARDRLPQLVTDSSAGVSTATFSYFQADENNPDYSSPIDHYSEINEATVSEAWTADNERPPAEGPYEGLDSTRVDELPAVTTADVYLPLRRVPESNTSSQADSNKRVRSLPTLDQLRDTVQ